MPNTNTQIEQLLAKIAEKKLSNDKLDLWLLEHWQNELLKLKYQKMRNEVRPI